MLIHLATPFYRRMPISQLHSTVPSRNAAARSLIMDNSRQRVIFSGTAVSPEHMRYLGHLLYKIAPQAHQINGQNVGRSKHLHEKIRCFYLNRNAMISLVDAMHLLFRQRSKLRSASGSSKFAILMPLMACAKSMALFDSYGGNQASINAILAGLTKVAKSPNASANFKAALSKFRDDATKHIELIQDDILYLAGKINADPNNGINYTIMVKDDQGKTSFLWPKDSDYIRARDYKRFKMLNGGNFPLTKDKWMALINEHLIPQYEHTIDLSKVVKENGSTFEDVSIEQLKKMSFQDNGM